MSANADLCMAVENASYLNRLDACVNNLLGNCRIHKGIFGNDNLARLRIDYIVAVYSAYETLFKLLDNVLAFLDFGNIDAVMSMAVKLADDNILRNVNKAACKITGIGSSERCIGKTFTRTVS